MRAVIVLVLTLAFVGCQRVDSDRATSLDDQAAPAPAAGEVARPATSTRDATTPVPPVGDYASPAGDASTRDLPASGESAVRPDNTAINERDRDSAAKTPLDQGENEADRNATAEIRQRIVNAENMSVNARNVKIITSGGKVTLRGPVNSAGERETIVRFAREVAGEGNVEDQLEVANSAAPNP